ncbi:MAG TPA: hypothetical protein ENJ35_05015, partial [Gammaproteobacteria bacterium]|nr:hypothetical protein [Gammaproteobacteria bacterium]
MRWRSCALVFLLGVQVVAGADALPEVVVEAVETAPRVGDVVLSETTAAITTISGEALTRPGNSLAQVLSREAGVQIRSSGGLGSYSAATLRGASSDQVMVYLDGLLLNDASGGGFNLADVELMQVDRIDIYRGSTPVQLSTASLGGALDLQSPAVDGKPLWRGQVGAGSFNTRQAGLLFSGSAGKVGGLLSLNARSSDNDFSFRNDNGTALNPADDFDDHRNNAAADQSSLLLKLGKPVADGAHQDASFQYFNKSQQIPDQRNSNFNRASLDTKTLRLQFNHRQNRVWQSDWNTRLGFNLSHKREEYDDRQSTIGLGKQHSRWLTDVAGINNYWEHVGETKSFSLSTDFRREKYHQDDLLGLNPGSIARRDELTLAAQESLFFNGDKTLLTPELRYQVATDYFDVAGASFSGTKINKHITH